MKLDTFIYIEDTFYITIGKSGAFKIDRKSVV